MFCTQCGKQSGGADKFCSGCGHPLAGIAVEPSSALAPPSTPIEVDWKASDDFREVFGHPHVQARIRRVADSSKTGMSAEEFLKIAQPLMSLAGAGSVKLSVLSGLVVPLYAKLGMKSQTEVQSGFKSSFGETLAASLCALAARGQAIQDIKSAENGCLIEAKLPSSMWNWEGSLFLSLEHHPEGILAKGNVSIPGQAFDWGRGKATLNTLFEDIRTYRDMEL